MKAIQLASPKCFETIEVAEPASPGSGQALVRTHAMGICGTDISCYLGKFPFFAYPRIPGHELGVEVLAVGEGVSGIYPGDRCSVEPYMNCGHCFACRNGAMNCCVNLEVIGVMTHGGLCDRFLIRADKLHPSKILTYEQLALVETLAIGCHATDRGQPQAGDSVLIIGAGPIGLATLEFTRLTGAQITVMDLSESRLEFCQRQYGVEQVIRPTDPEETLAAAKSMTRGDLFKLVVDATGNAASMSQSLAYVAATGTLVFVGITTDEIHFRHPQMHRPEMTLKASRNALPGDFAKIISLIETGVINTDSWVTHRTTFDHVARDFPTLIDPANGTLKAMIAVQN